MLFFVLCCLSVFVSTTASVRENHQNFIYDLINKTWTDKVFKLQNHNGTPILLEETAEVPRLNRTVRRPNNDKLDIEDGKVVEAPEDVQIDQTENGENKVIEVHSKELGNHTITKGAHSISIHSETIW